MPRSSGRRPRTVPSATPEPDAFEDPDGAALRQGLRAALPDWGFSAASELALLGRSENIVYRATDPARTTPLVLRVHRVGYHDAAEIASELAWVRALVAADVIATPAPIATADGRATIAFRAGGTTRSVTAFAHARGVHPDDGTASPALHRALGGIAARLHAHGRAWRRPAGFVRKIWDADTILGRHAHWGDVRAIATRDAWARTVLDRAATRLAATLAERAPARGLIHGDMRAANLLVDDDRLVLIDFDDCGIGWLGFDFAASVSFREHAPEIPALMAAWVEGYRAIARLDDAEVAVLPLFVLVRRLQLAAWLQSRPEAGPGSGLGLGPEYAQRTVAMADAYLAGGLQRLLN